MSHCCLESDALQLICAPVSPHEPESSRVSKVLFTEAEDGSWGHEPLDQNPIGKLSFA